MLSIGLSGRTHLNLTVSSRPASLQKFQDLGGILAAPAVLCVLRLGPSRGASLCAFEPGTTETLALGSARKPAAEANDARTQSRGPLTSVEQLVMRRLTSALTDSLRTVWQEILPLRPEILRFETDPRMAAIMAPNDVAIACAFDVGGAFEGRMLSISSSPTPRWKLSKAALALPPAKQA